MSEPVVLLNIDKRGVATITLNRPEVNNAYNGEFVQAMINAVVKCSNDDDIRIIIIRGNGKHFQAGADLKWLKEIGELSPKENVDVSRLTASAIRGLTEVMKPTIALVHGGCFGGGTGIVSSCDIVIASEDAMFSITEARWGVMASIIVPQLNAAIGPRNTRRYALTCERFAAKTALDIGLVHQTCPTGDLDSTVAPIIENLLLAAPIATSETKRATLRDAGLIISDDYFEELVNSHAAKRQTDEAMEGLASFAEKRNPSWYPS
jgi:methylglutaconyl-CoA hydratase